MTPRLYFGFRDDPLSWSGNAVAVSIIAETDTSLTIKLEREYHDENRYWTTVEKHSIIPEGQTYELRQTEFQMILNQSPRQMLNLYARWDGYVWIDGKPRYEAVLLQKEEEEEQFEFEF